MYGNTHKHTRKERERERKRVGEKDPPREPNNDAIGHTSSGFLHIHTDGRTHTHAHAHTARERESSMN